MPILTANKTFADTYIYSIDTNNVTARNLTEFILKADRIDKESAAFKSIMENIKTRQVTTVLFRILKMDKIVLCTYTKELPASFKVFEAKDMKDNNRKKVFIDLTGLVKLTNGYFTCKDIDKFIAYLTNALVFLIYGEDRTAFTNNANIIKSSTDCFISLFNGVFDNLRVINFHQNKEKIGYIAGVYYINNLMQKDLEYAEKMSSNLMDLRNQANALKYYYDESNLKNIDTMITNLKDVFKLGDISTSVFIERWMFLYGKGTMYGMELLPAFLTMITSVYSGSYLNNQKSIELRCGRELVNVSNEILRVGAAIYE